MYSRLKYVGLLALVVVWMGLLRLITLSRSKEFGC
jgi:hypothetical protein